MRTSVKATWTSFFVLLAVTALVALSTGCAPFLDRAYQTAGTFATALKGGAEAWQAYDADVQRKIVAPAKSQTEADQLLATHRAGKQAEDVRIIQAVRHSLGVLYETLKAYQAGAATEADVNAAIASTLRALLELGRVLVLAKVPLPEVFKLWLK